MPVTNPNSAHSAFGHPVWRNMLLGLLISMVAACGSIAIVGPYSLGQALRYPEATFTSNCNPLVVGAPVVTGLNRISYRFTQCYRSSDLAEQVASWYEKQGWTQRVYTPIAQATKSELHRFGPLMVVSWNQVTALHLSRSPTLIKVEVGFRIILNR